MTVLPGSLSPGDRVWSPGGEAVVVEVEPSGSLVRLTYRDRTGPAFVYLRAGTPIVPVGQDPGPRPTVSVHREAISATRVPEEPTMPDYEPTPREALAPLNLSAEEQAWDPTLTARPAWCGEGDETATCWPICDRHLL